MTIISILIAIVVFGIIICIHEWGHFSVAKKCDVKINEFSFGMGPCIFKRKKGEVQYSIRAFPIGGFVSMEGEDESSDDDRAFNKKTVWQRIAIVVAGAVMNLILGFFLVVIFTIASKNIISTQIAGFTDNSISASVLQVGDKIIKVNGARVFSDIDFSYKLATDKDSTYDFVVKRDGKKVELDNVTVSKSDGYDFKVKTVDKNPLTILQYSFRKSLSIGKVVWMSIGDLINGTFSVKEMSGPVGIVTVIGDTVNPAKQPNFNLGESVLNLIYLMALITINVGIFNLLPLPALDGGRIIFLLIELIRGKPIKPEHEGMVHFVGIALLMVLMIFVTFNDITRLF